MRIAAIGAAVSWRVRRYRRRLRHGLVRLDRRAIHRALTDFGSAECDVVLVHSSLSACGFIRGGPLTVVEALGEWVSGRTLTMPTFTYCYPDKTEFDVASTPSLVGAITDCFWRRPGVVRSLHPTHSIAFQGPGSSDLCTGHELANTPCGFGTPFRRLVDHDCSVLMFGATMASYTLFHTAEDDAKVPYLYEPQPYTLIARDSVGARVTVVMQRQDSSVARRFEAMDSWLQKQGLLKRRRLGSGELLFIPHAATVHQRLITELRQDPLFLVASGARREIRQRFGF